MDRKRKEALTKNLPEICETLELTEVLVFLVSRGILKDVQRQQIQAESIPYQRNNALVSTLLRSSNEAYDLFLESLIYSNQASLANIIIDQFNNLNEQPITDNQDRKLAAPMTVSTVIQSKKANIIKEIPGFNGFTPFCLVKNTQNALVIADSNYVLVDLNSDKKTVLKTEYHPKTVNRRICFIHTVVRASKTFVISLTIGDVYRKDSFLVSQHFGFPRVTPVDMVQLEIECISCQSWANIQENEAGVIYCIVNASDFHDKSKIETVFHALQIHVNDSGKIKTTLLAKNIKLKGAWYAPFLHLNRLNWLPMNRDDGILLQVVFNQNSFGCIEVSSEQVVVDIKDLHSSYEILLSACQNPAVIGSHVFYYDNTGEQLLHLDIGRKRWKTLPLKMRSEPFYSAGANLRALSNDRLFLSVLAYIHVLPGTSVFNVPPRDRPQGRIFCINIEWETSLFTNVIEKPNQQINTIHPAEGMQGQTLIARSDQHKRSNKNWIPPAVYEQREKLGSGAFGIVYKCWDPIGEVAFVAKHTHIQSDQIMGGAQNEIDLLKSCSHEKIIAYFGCKTEQNTIIIFMEYMPKGSLFQYIREHGPISEQVAVNYIPQVLEGLTYIHRKGIVHSDLKCDNLLLDEHDNVKIGDFGIAIQKQLNSINHSYFLTNTKGGGAFHWTAPEVLKQIRGSGRQSDVWSFGCTVVEMLTGQPPHGQVILAELMHKLYSNLLSYDPEVLIAKASGEMKLFLSQLLETDISKRPHTGEDAALCFYQQFADIL